VVIFRPVVDEQEHPCGGETLDEPVEQSLGLAIDPVEILEHHEQRLLLTLPEQQVFDSVQRALAALLGVQGRPLCVLGGNVQERQHGRHRRFQRTIERQQ
jgi:hypothetical protein